MTDSVTSGPAASVAGRGVLEVMSVSNILTGSLSLVVDVLGLLPAGPSVGSVGSLATAVGLGHHPGAMPAATAPLAGVTVAVVVLLLTTTRPRAMSANTGMAASSRSPTRQEL